jgi:mannose-6-phosphate isomerase-like protein (cupin superfamily)
MIRGMKLVQTTRHRKKFDVMLSSRSAQAAMMTLRPGDSSSDEPENDHPRCEQWLYVVSGTARAKTNKRRIVLRAGSLLLIEKNEPHQITCTGRSPLVTLNLYVPPAYTDDGNVKRGAQTS